MISADPGNRPGCHEEWFLSSNKLFKEGESRLSTLVDYGFMRVWNLLNSLSNDDGEYLGGDSSESERKVRWLYALPIKNVINVSDRC